MAVCVSMMIGRVGSVVGSVIIGVMINEYCKYTFLMPIVLLFSSAVLAFTIPNIGKRIK
jgi:MFS transporter, VNT family, synaptic vesicle glycoprotein 2